MKKTVKLYIDIDGVLLTTKNQKAATDIEVFVAFITHEFDCYWLTTHCKGRVDTAITYLSQFLEEVTIEYLKKIKPTNWDSLKTDAVDFQSDFIWLDDAPFQSEIKVLEFYNCEKSLLLVDLSNPTELLEIMEFLDNKIIER